MAHLITGYAGSEHIKSSDQGSFNAAFFGEGQFVMQIGSEFSASVLSNNLVRILDGDMLMYGRHIRIEPNTHEDITIQTGTAGYNRTDIICMTYEKNMSTGVERAYLEAVQGTPSEGDAEAPVLLDGNIINGATKNQMPLYRVHLSGIVLTSIEKVFETIKSYSGLAEQYAEVFYRYCEEFKANLGIDKQLSTTSENAISNKAVSIEMKNMVQTFENITVSTSAWVDNNNFDFPFKANITLQNVTESHVPIVNFSISDAASGIFSSVTESYNGGVIIYAAEIPEREITIPSIVMMKGVVA